MRADGELIIGTVVMSMPEYGAAKVVTCGGAPTIKEPILCYLPYSDANCGSLLQSHIQDGSTVICMRSYSNPNQGYILTAVNEAQADLTDTLDGRVFYATNRWTTWHSKIFDTVINQLKDFAGTIFRNRANSVDKDVLPGDTDITNNNGTAAIHVGKYLVQMKGSPIAFIDVAAIKDQIRMVAARIEMHTLTTYKHIESDVAVDNMATSAPETFGFPFGADVNEKWDEAAANGVPFFRMQHTKGALIDGEEKIILAFPPKASDSSSTSSSGEKQWTYEPSAKKAQESTENTLQETADMHTDTTEPPTLHKDRTALSGERTIATTQSIHLVKTPSISSVLQYGYSKVNAKKEEGTSKDLDLLTPYVQENAEDEEESAEVDLDKQIMDAAINRVVDKLLTKDYLPVLKQRMAEAGLIVSESSLDDLFKDHTTTGPTTQTVYDPPKFLQLTDPVTGKVHTYFDSTSFISQEEDGSILICDGYGSEIRMSQGNIYISPALDLQLRPGRDMWGLVPRHMTLDSQGYSELNSMKAVYIRSTGDMQIAAATEGKGKLTLECDSKANGEKSGVIIRSLGNVAMTGHDLYIGVNKGTSMTKGRTELVQNPGSIIIDAGENGGLVHRCRLCTVDTMSFTVVGGGSGRTGKHAAFTVSTNMIGLYAEIVQMPAQLNISAVNGTEEVAVMRNGEMEQQEINTATAPHLYLKGAFRFNGTAMVVSGSIYVTKDVMATNVGYVEGSGKIVVNDIEGNFFKKQWPVDNLEINSELKENSGYKFVEFITETIYQDYYIASNCFKFPEDYGVSESFVIPGMVWQENTRLTVDDPNSVVWTEEPVLDVDGETLTAAYPGWSAWVRGRITQKGYEKGILLFDYITNTKKETSNE